MEPQTDSNNQFKPLDCETDILLIEKDTFTVERFKDIARQKLIILFGFKCLEKDSREGRGDWSIMDRLHHQLPIGELNIPIKNSKWIFPIEGIKCQLLKIGASTWQKGKLRIEASLRGENQIKVSLEFCSDDSYPKEGEAPKEGKAKFEEVRSLINPAPNIPDPPPPLPIVTPPPL